MDDIQSKGWSNHETWLLKVWLYEMPGGKKLLDASRKQSDDAFEQAQWLQEQLHTQLDTIITEPGLWFDLLHTAFNRIDFEEIVENG
jgi:hypothetical protein